MRRGRPALGSALAVVFALLGASPSWSANGTRADVTLTLTPHNPPITIPYEGGGFGYHIETINHEPNAVSFNVWTTYTLPGGGGTEPGYGPVDLLLPAGWSAGSDLTQEIPGGMPEGTYLYTAYAGIYPDQVWSSDSFDFVKLPGTAGWYAQSPGTDVGIYGVSFVDANTGWAVTRYREIIHTTDGGDIWARQEGDQYYYRYYGVQFTDPENGWIVGDAYSSRGIILHSSDAGTTWTEQQPHYGYPLNKVFFTDADNGWAVGGLTDGFGGAFAAVIEHTSNGGQAWAGQLVNYYDHYPFSSVHFADPASGWVVGPLGVILHTGNGGASWTAQASGTGNDLTDVFFASPDIGWCVGENSTVLHTTNAGASWQAQSIGASANLAAVEFLDASTGWIAGTDWNLEEPVIFKTEDGGLSWHSQDTGSSSGILALADMDFVDANHGWAAGTLISGGHEFGAMLHTENGGGAAAGIGTPGPGLGPEQAGISVPFPNPFNPRTRLRLTVPGEAARHVSVTIYDPQGRRVRTLFDGSKDPGEHIIEWDGTTDSGEPAASGIYVCGARIDEAAVSRKLMLLR